MTKLLLNKSSQSKIVFVMNGMYECKHINTLKIVSNSNIESLVFNLLDDDELISFVGLFSAIMAVSAFIDVIR